MAEEQTAQDLLDQVEVERLPPGIEGQLKHEIASNIYGEDVLAKRHGIKSVRKYLVDHPWLIPEIQLLRAQKSSELSVQDRCRQKAGLASEELIPDMVSVVASPTTSAASKIDAFKQLNRMAGIDGLPAATRDNQAQPGTAFNLTINLPNGKSETITTVVEEQTAIVPTPEDAA